MKTGIERTKKSIFCILNKLACFCKGIFVTNFLSGEMTVQFLRFADGEDCQSAGFAI
jgi:hypothetical protein